MYALKVQINDEVPVIAGAEDLAVLNAIGCCTGMLGSATVRTRDDETQDFSLSLGGLTSRPDDQKNEHLNWLSQAPLKSGDKVFVEIVETEMPDPAIGGVEAEKRKSEEREDFEHCKQVYLSMHSKYEPEA